MIKIYSFFVCNIRGLRRERGSGSVLALCLVATCILVVNIVFVGFGAYVAYARAASVSDLASITAADVLVGRIAGIPCEQAQYVTTVNGLELVECVIEKDTFNVYVRVREVYLGFTVEGQSRAGPKALKAF